MDDNTRKNPETPSAPPEDIAVPPEDSPATASEVPAADAPPSDELPTGELPTGELPAGEPPADEDLGGGKPDPLLLLEQELADTKDKLLRALAESENVRRRAQKDREQSAKYGVTNFARDVLTVADNLRRALEALPDEVRKADETIRGIVEGIELTERELLAAFDRYAIKKVDPMGEKFNHDLHEAMFEVPTADAEPGSIVQVMEVGYMLHDRLLRPARVGVAKAPPEAAPPEGVDTTA